VTGTLRLGTESVAVAGHAWMDREWSTSALAPGEVGWDWFALQLDDGWELMLYRIRRAAPAAAQGAGPGASPGGSTDARSGAGTGASSGASRGAEPATLVDPASRVTLIAPDGRTQVLPFAALRFEETAHWTSPSGARYPAGWRLALPGDVPASET